MGIQLTLLFSFIASVALGFIKVRYSSETTFRACFTNGFAFYLFVLAFGNIATTLLARASLSEFFSNSTQSISSTNTTKDEIDQKASDLSTFPINEYDWFWSVFIGVFAFEAILQRINVTFQDQGVLTINEWISIAHDNAVGDAIKLQVDLDYQQTQKLAKKLKTLPEVELNTQVITQLGEEKLDELNKKANRHQCDSSLAKALALALESPNQAKAIANNIQNFYTNSQR